LRRFSPRRRLLSTKAKQNRPRPLRETKSPRWSLLLQKLSARPFRKTRSPSLSRLPLRLSRRRAARLRLPRRRTLATSRRSSSTRASRRTPSPRTSRAPATPRERLPRRLPKPNTSNSEALACDAELEDVRAWLGHPPRRTLATPSWRMSELGSGIRSNPRRKMGRVSPTEGVSRLRPVAVGITGGIGAGETEALSAFARHGAAMISSDAVVATTAPEDHRRECSPVSSPEQRERRLIPDEEKAARADFSYVNDGTRRELDEFVAETMRALEARQPA